MATELFSADRATTTVSSGGTTAPSSGTSESWTVASSAMFGAAATGLSQFHVADPAAPSEMIAVTNVSGTTWTVTRGAESTTPVAHAAGFTVYQVVTAGYLSGSVVSAAQFRTTSDGSNTATYAGQQTFGLVPALPVANLQTVTVRPDQQFQQILGVGAAITDSAAYNLMTYLNSGQRTALLTELFGPAAGFSTVRIALGWQNFSSFSTPFTYDDTTGASRTLGCTNGSNTVTDSSAASGDAGKAINLTNGTTGTTGFAGNAFVGTVTGGVGYTVVTAPGGSTASNFLGTNGSYSATLYPLDLNLANFTLGSDMTYVVPVLQQIMQINPRVRVFATPWSPPLWMRVTGSQTGVAGRSASNQAQNSDIQTYLLPQFGQYIAQAVMAYEALGIPIYAVSPQNEPFDPAGSVCYYTDTDYATLISDVGYALDNAGLRTRIFAHDYHWNGIGRITPDDPTSQSNPTGSTDSTAFLTQAASRFVSDIGYHAYTEEVDNFGVTFRPVNYYYTSLGQEMVRRYNRTVNHHLTEIRCMFTQTWASSISLIAAACTVGNFQRWGQSLTMWNLALDQNGGPNGSAGRRGVITINNPTGAITRNPEYWIMRHIGQFVQPGAYRAGCTSPIAGADGQDLQAVAFTNPDGSNVCFAVNNSPYTRAMQVTDDRTGTGFTVQLQPYEFDTFTWAGRTANPAAATYTPSTPASIILDTASTGGYAQAATPGANSQTLTWSHTVGTGTHPVLVVGIACDPHNSTTPNVSTVTFGGSSLTKWTDAFNTTGSLREADIWYLVNPPAGPGTVLVTLVDASSQIVGISSSWFNVNQSTPFRTAGTAVSNGSTSGLTVTTTGGAASDVVLGCYSVHQAQFNTVNGFQTGQIRLGQVAESGTSNLYGCMTQQPGGTGTITTTFVNSDGVSDAQAAVAAALVNG